MRADQRIPYEAHLCTDYFDLDDRARKEEEYEESLRKTEGYRAIHGFIVDWRPESERHEEQ